MFWIPESVLGFLEVFLDSGQCKTQTADYCFHHANENVTTIDLVTVFDAILTSRQTREKFQCLYENLMSDNFRKTAVVKKISIVN